MCSLLGDCAPTSVVLGAIVEKRRWRAFSSASASPLAAGVPGVEANSGCERSVRRQSTSMRWRSCPAGSQR